MLFHVKIGLVVHGIAMLLLSAVAAIGQPAPAWHSIVTKNFTLIGDTAESDLRSEAARIETFRKAFGQLLPRPEAWQF